MTHSNLTNSANSSNIQQPSTPNSSQSIHNKSPQQKIYEWFKKFPNFENKTPEKIDQTLDSLIANKSFLNSQDPLGNNALHLAIINQDIPTANKLVASGIDYKAKNFDGLTYLDIARSHGNEFFQSFTRSFVGPTSNEEITNQSARNSRDDSLILASIPELPEDQEDQIPSDFVPLPSPTKTSRSSQTQSLGSPKLGTRTAFNI